MRGVLRGLMVIAGVGILVLQLRSEYRATAWCCTGGEGGIVVVVMVFAAGRSADLLVRR